MERMEEQIRRREADSALLHLERAEALVQLLQPTAAVMTQALARGSAVALTGREASVGGRCAVADLKQSELDALASQLSERELQDRLTRGAEGLCLAEERFIGPEGISAPLLLWPVVLRRSGQGWQLMDCGEGMRPNTALLSRMSETPPEGGWSRQRERLLEQVGEIMARDGKWQRSTGLWLARLPLWLLDAGVGSAPVSGSARQRLEEGTLPVAPALDVEDTDQEEGIIAPMVLDGAQMTALRRLRAGGDVLAVGSRGTGKTQLAAALMANALGERQRALLISPAASDRTALMERLGELGLGEVCLDLPAQGDRKAALLRRFNLSAQLRPFTTSEDYFPLAAQAMQLGQSLDRNAAQLHKKGECGKSLFELICAYLENRAVEGHLPIPESTLTKLDQQGLQERLECAENLYQMARQLGGSRKHPLRMVRTVEYDPQYQEMLEKTGGDLREAVSELENGVELWLQRTELSQPVSRSDWSRLQQVGNELLKWESLPEQWKASEHIPLLSDMTQELKRHTQIVEEMHAQIEEAWGDAVLSMDAVELEKQWRYYQENWTLPNEAERETALRRLLAEAESLLNRLEQVGQQWSRAVDMEMPAKREDWERSCEIAEELARWKEIPREWGECELLSALLWDVNELIEVGRKAKESKTVLLRDWDESMLEQNGSELLRRWAHDGGKWGLTWLKRQNELRDELQPMCRVRLNADVIESGIRWLADYQYEIARCDEIYHRWEKELQSVYRREDTVWVWLETACRVADESKDWLSELTGSDDFLRKYGSKTEAVTAADTLREEWERACEVLGRLDVMIGRSSQGDSANWLNQRRSDCRRLRNLMNIRNRVQELTRESVQMSQIGEMLEALAACQLEENQLDNLYERWEDELEGLYDGADTDWDKLCGEAQRAVESDERIAQLTGDLVLRSKLAGDRQAIEAARTLVHAFDRVAEAEREIEHTLDARLSQEDGPWLEQLRANLDLLCGNREKLELWIRWNRLRKQAESLGLRAFVNCIEQPEETEEAEERRPRDVQMLFRKSIYRSALLQELSIQNPPFSSRQFNETLKRYVQTERLFTRRTREELMHLSASYATRSLRSAENREEVELLRQANRDGAQNRSAAELIRDLPALTAACFPCACAGPWEALRCYGGGEAPAFDYVILDRAEQYPAWLGTELLGLGRTALLLSQGERRMDSYAAGDDGSLWNRCVEAGWPVLRLNTCWLPRSESLHWLDETAFATACLPTARPDAFNLACKTVVGEMDQGTNKPEAEAVATEAVRQALAGRHVGIVAMTWAQRRLINTLMEQIVEERPDLAPYAHRIEVAAPEETISGRYELTMISLTLAPDRREQLYTAQRVAGGWEGWYTLSDALCTAKSEVWVYCSLDRQDWFKMSGAQPVIRLLEYIDREQVPWKEYPVTNRIQQEICDALNRAGFAAEPGPWTVSVQVAKRNAPHQPVLGILLDDPSYNAICRTRERELNRTQLLQERGWQLCRVWAMDWWRSPREVQDGLLQAMERLQGKKAQSKQTEPPRSSKKEERSAPLYQPAELAVLGIQPGEIASPAFRNRITRVVDDILQQEAPMSQQQLTTRLLTLFGLDDTAPELRQACQRLWEVLDLRTTREGELCFVWMESQDPDHWRGYRRSGTGVHYRAPEDVSAQESANAACALLEQEASLTALALAQETARALGYDPAEEAALECGRRGVEHALFLGRAMETAIGSLMPGVRK